MRASQAGQFPLISVVHPLAVVSAVVPNVRRGVRYRVISTQDCWISYGEPAEHEKGLYLPAKVPDYFAFGMDDSQGTDLQINVIGAFPGTIYFTPMRTVPTEG